MDRGAWQATVHRVAELDAAQQWSTHTLRKCRRAHFADTSQEKAGGIADFRAGGLSRTEGLYL